MGVQASISPNYLGSGFFGGVYSYGAPIGRGPSAAVRNCATDATARSALYDPNATPDLQVATLQTRLDQIQARLHVLTATSALSSRSVSAETTNIIADLKQIQIALQAVENAPSADIGAAQRDIEAASVLQSCSASRVLGGGSKSGRTSILSGLESQLGQLNALLATLVGLLGGVAAAGSPLGGSDLFVAAALNQAIGSYRQSAVRASVSPGLALNI